MFGNVLLGPTAENLPDKANTSTSTAGLQSLLEQGRRILPALGSEEVTSTYAGLRAATEHLARAGAELLHAAAAVGDHASAVQLRAAAEDLQLLQAQLATASEKAFTLGQLAIRRAQHAGIQRRANDATSGPER